MPIINFFIILGLLFFSSFRISFGATCSSYGNAGCVGTERNCTLLYGGTVVAATTCTSPNPVCCKFPGSNTSCSRNSDCPSCNVCSGGNCVYSTTLCPSSCTTSSSCAGLGGSCGAPGRPGTTHTGICPGGTECVCIVPPACSADCAATDGGVCWGLNYTGNCGQTCTGNKISWDDCFNCNEKTYWTMYPDVKNAGMHPYYHYQTYGAAEGRIWQDPYCDGSTLFNCGTATPKNCGDTSTTCTGTTYTSSTGCGTCTGTKPIVNGTSGVCGASAGDRLTTVPTTGLCTTGGASAVTVGTSTFSWTCAGTVGTCGGTIGTTPTCTAIRDNPPTYVSMVVKNTSGVTVAAEAGGRNQICDTNFSADGTVRFVVTFTDIQGGNDINSADLGISDGSYNKTYTTTTFTVSGNNATATFNVPKSDISSTNLLNIYARPYDDHSTITSGAADTGRDFKFWNCNVPVSGKLYDGGDSGSCSVAADYITEATDTNFNTLDFTDSPTMNMNRVSESEYNGNLTWGKVYTTIFNTDLAMQISGSGVKTTDVSAGTSSCPNSVAFTLNNTILNPYSASPTLKVDFSGVVDQDSWYQALGGGLMTNTRITNRVPVTCTTNCAMSISGTTNTNGIVASPTINNNGNSGVNKGNPNNWWVTKPLVSTSKSDYTYFLNQYFWKSGIGTTLNGDKYFSDLGANPTGVYFINGNLSVTTGNTVPVGSFLMVVASGNINVDQSVTNLEGVFVSKNFNVGGSNATALNFEGMIKATENVKVYRTFINKRTNNTTPAVNFVYRPDFIFSMPGEIAKQLTKWQWGN